MQWVNSQIRKQHPWVIRGLWHNLNGGHHVMYRGTLLKRMTPAPWTQYPCPWKVRMHSPQIVPVPLATQENSSRSRKGCKPSESGSLQAHEDEQWSIEFWEGHLLFPTTTHRSRESPVEIESIPSRCILPQEADSSSQRASKALVGVENTSRQRRESRLGWALSRRSHRGCGPGA